MGVARVFVVVLALICIFVREGRAATFTFVNRCTGTVWPGIQSNAGSSRLDPTGFVLPPGTSRAVPAPSGWSGRVWARTGCAQDATGKMVCATGDCGSGSLECNGQNAATPATLAEFTLAGGAGDDFYDVSLVDGYNLPILIEPAGAATGATTCAAAGCTADLNARCPAELRTEGGAGCRSACDAFGKPEYCCSGAYANPNTCRPTAYSQVFKSACPKSYSYAYDDPTSTFTCAGGRDYTITFCPVATPSVKSSGGPGATTAPPTGGLTPTLPGAGTGATPQMPRPAGQQGGPDGQGVMLGDNSWLASLATGDASSAPPTSRPVFRALPLAPALLLLGLLL
ncbi:hypothetical protein SEVIR_9G475500v4 [Setaria viridis]|uniref:Thaumatin-like protein 1 n=2 Tax=Setaria TaxID=4554 RepID=K4AC68_SETIT|nr:thaumatin-like protein 1b [Setaria italica]XP_034576303.1 thaumatin-like protein 1 [Setaria viridis]RCV45654.1 hypothetical protein SETIT_9G471900v2 [Setaria italica]TKV97131.1 hypothetical protein SEVIR_9G475500v2 [Setaria viridis]